MTFGTFVHASGVPQWLSCRPETRFRSTGTALCGFPDSRFGLSSVFLPSTLRRVGAKRYPPFGRDGLPAIFCLELHIISGPLSAHSRQDFESMPSPCRAFVFWA